jgi:hypothetical protein
MRSFYATYDFAIEDAARIACSCLKETKCHPPLACTAPCCKVAANHAIVLSVRPREIFIDIYSIPTLCPDLAHKRGRAMSSTKFRLYQKYHGLEAAPGAQAGLVLLIFTSKFSEWT